MVSQPTGNISSRHTFLGHHHPGKLVHHRRFGSVRSHLRQTGLSQPLKLTIRALTINSLTRGLKDGAMMVSTLSNYCYNSVTIQGRN